MHNYHIFEWFNDNIIDLFIFIVKYDNIIGIYLNM